MKLKKILLLAFLSGSLIFPSCNNYLDLQPEDGVVRQEFWKTKEQVEAAMNGCYAALLAPKLTENLFLWGELRADMVTYGNVMTANDYNVVNMNINANNPITNWETLYFVINLCNDVIDSAPEVLKTDKTFTQENLNQYTGQALALRSLMYFYLVRSFGEVPLKLKATHTDSDNLQIPKSTQAEVLDQIVRDLKTAEEYTLASYSNKEFNKGKITKYAVQTILADVFLWMEKYEDCIAYCDKVISSGQYALVPATDTWFSTLYYQGGSVEGIFELYFNVNRTNPFFEMFASGNKRFKAAISLMSLYGLDPMQVEKDIRGDGASYKISDLSIWKYQGVNAGTTRGDNSSTSYGHWFFYRYADVLLMKAEALNQVNRGQEALDLVNEIRQRAGALPSTEKVVSADNRLEMADYILEERSREFAFEGKRWYDLLRNAKRNNYERLDLLMDVVLTTALPEYQSSAITKYRDFNSHYFPYFFQEIQANKALVQNPFYQ